MLRAAQFQATAHRVEPAAAASYLAEVYQIRAKTKDWREFGDVAFHLVAAWPPDLAYVILYALRQTPLKYDPVPFVLKAIEMLPRLRREYIVLHLEPSARVDELKTDMEASAIAAANMIVREISCAPLRHASGIYRLLDERAKPYVRQQLEAMNPKAAAILLKGSLAWLDIYRNAQCLC